METLIAIVVWSALIITMEFAMWRLCRRGLVRLCIPGRTEPAHREGEKRWCYHDPVLPLVKAIAFLHAGFLLSVVVVTHLFLW